MEKQFTTFEISKVLKRLGFNEPCFGYYEKPIENIKEPYVFNMSYIGSYQISKIHDDVDYIMRPTWQQVIDYIREKHNIHIVIDKVCNIDFSKTYWNYELTYVDNEDIIMEEKNSGFNSYKKSRLKSIKHCFNIIDPTWDYLINR